MNTGKVLNFNAQKGYGFIKPDTDGCKDLFVHITGLLQRGGGLQAGDEVSYEIGRSERGDKAIRVKVINRAGGSAGHVPHRD